MGFNAGENESFEVGFTGNQEVFGDAGELIGGASHLGHFDGMAFALGRTDKLEGNPMAGYGRDAAGAIRDDGSRKRLGVGLDVRCGVK